MHQDQPSRNIGRQWFAVRTYTGKELLAKANYNNQGFVCYLPRILATRRHARRIETVARACFPGYLFLHLGPAEQRWTTIASTKGAIAPVHFGGIYPVMPDWVIDALQGRENEAGLIPLQTITGPHLKPGDRVQVYSSEENQELEAIFHSFRGADRAVILLDILQRQVRTVVPVASLTAA